MWWDGGHVQSTKCEVTDCACHLSFGSKCGPRALWGSQSRMGTSQRAQPPPTPCDLFDTYQPYSSSDDVELGEDQVHAWTEDL